MAWTGSDAGTIVGVVNNVQWRDYYNIDLRVSKNFKIGDLDLEFFADITNALNIKRLERSAFINTEDYDAYMRSLHLPAAVGRQVQGYSNVAGSDKPGDYRTVDYSPYDPNDPDPKHKQWVLDNKAYIDMPNQQYSTFLNPREVYWGLRLTFELN